MSTQDHVDAIGRDVLGNDLQAGVAVDHHPQASGEEVLEVSDGERDVEGIGHEGRRTGSAALLHRQFRLKG